MPPDGFERVACLVCGSDRPRVFYSHRHDAFLGVLGIDARVTWNMCMTCGLLYQSPRPRKALLVGVYRQSYRPATPSPTYLGTKRADAADKIAWMSRYTGDDGQGRRVLDIGSGEGSLLHELSRVGWNGYGTEITESFARWGEAHFGVKVHIGEFDATVYRGMRFDLVTLSHLLEHIHAPFEFLASVRERLEPTGRVFVEVPDFRILRGSLSQNVFASPHLWGFSKQTVCDVIRRAGFSVVVAEELTSRRGHVIRLLAEVVGGVETTTGLENTAAVANELDGAYRRLRRQVVRHQVRYFVTVGWKDAVKRTATATRGVIRREWL